MSDVPWHGRLPGAVRLDYSIGISNSHFHMHETGKHGFLETDAKWQAGAVQEAAVNYINNALSITRR